MKLKKLYLLLLLFTAQAQCELEQCDILERVIPLSAEEFECFLNPTQAEQEFVYSLQPAKPPSFYMIWLRKIGLPLANAYLTVRRAVRASLHWLGRYLYFKQKVCDERSY